MNQDLWVFGYGSLVWRPDLPHAEARPAWIAGWTRRFWQASTDHRGTPQAPGRVVTLIAAAEEQCWGRAYRVAAAEVPSVLATLDHREKDGYDRTDVQLNWADGGGATGLVYVASPTNENFLGPAPLAEMAAQIGSRVGPSGPNRAYLLELAAALREMGADDPHVFALESALLGLQGRRDQ